MNNNEQRRFTRFEFVSACTILRNKDRREFSATILNISTSGVLVQCINECVSPGEQVEITFSIEKDGINNLACFGGTVARSSNDGLGIEISEVDFKLYSKFIDIILLANEDCMKIKSSIFSSDDFVKQWKGGYLGY